MSDAPARSPHGLSKSKVLSWLQCPKRLWLELNKPQAATTSEGAERLFAVGHDVGRVAQQLRPAGVLIASQEDLSKALAETAAHIEAGTRVLFEPTFRHGGVLVRADILRRKPAGYEIREVKAAGSMKDCYHQDAAIQAWVLRGSGLKLDSVVIQHVKTSFVYQGDGNYRGLFKESAVDDDIRPLAKEVPNWVKGAQATLAGSEPKLKTGKHCHEPYDCPCLEYCSSKEPQTKYPLTVLPNAGKTLPKLIEDGYVDVRDIPTDRLTSQNHQRVRRVSKSGKAELDLAARAVISAMPYPRYYLDFETVGVAVPLWAGTRPYQQIPFQWSCHIETSPGKVRHAGFLDTSGNAPMAPFAESLVAALGDHGPILSHNAGFEKARVADLAHMVPRHKRALLRLLPRFEDTLALTRSYYYHPRMMGSWSLKVIVPIIAPDLDYDDVGEVQDGGAASAAYLEIISESTPPERRAELRASLEKYCKRDTEALVRLLAFLQTGK